MVFRYTVREDRETMTTQTREPEKPIPTDQPVERQSVEQLTVQRPARVRLSSEETRARMKSFVTEREEAFVAAVREDED
jgi:hypothetical protein